MENCEQHTQLVADLAVIKTDIKYIRDKVCNHVQEGEKEGGFRDRLLILENKTAQVEKNSWRTCILSGIIGGFVGKLSPELINFLVNNVFAHTK